MSNYPKTISARKAMRTRIRNEVMADAEVKAQERGRSLKCAGHGPNTYLTPRHAGTPDGCRNDGSNCICECHDPKGDQ